MSEPFLGEIKLFAGTFAPRGYALCDGQLLLISQNDALFALLGTIYGGNGRTTFALPDLRGRVALHQGQGPGLSSRPIGSRGGSEQATVSTNQLPSHSHALQASTNTADDDEAAGNMSGAGAANNYSSAGPNANMSTAAITSVGGSQSHENRMPFLGINHIIALQGIFPSRQ